MKPQATRLDKKSGGALKNAAIALCYLVGAFTLIAMFWKGVIDYLDMPVVTKHPVTKECVKVETAPDRKPLTCQTIKGHKYHTVWGVE